MPADPLLNRYREIIGGIMYLSVSTRPDVAQALNVLARFSENPQKEHLTAARHLLAVLTRTEQKISWVMRMRTLPVT
jgi:hypothetical protein